MNSRPGYEEPVGLLAGFHNRVSDAGYGWVLGEFGTKSRRSKDLFLAPNPGCTFNDRILPPNVYLEFQQTTATKESSLSFANRFGELGLTRVHFHSKESEVGSAEAYTDWVRELESFQFAFRIWQLAQDRDGSQLNHLMKKAGISSSSPTPLPAEVRTTPYNIAKNWVCDEINRHFFAGISLPQGVCYLPGCPVGRFPPVPLPSGHLTYSVTWRLGRGDPQVEARLEPTNLLMTVWLQFADLVCGRKTIRPCEVCKQLMDVTDAGHIGSKRMHDRCSRRVRMQRYRKKMKELDPL